VDRSPRPGKFADPGVCRCVWAAPAYIDCECRGALDCSLELRLPGLDSAAGGGKEGERSQRRIAHCTRSEPVFELKPRDLAEVAVVVRDQRHAERESMRRDLGIKFPDRRALALQNGV
jgi:hypothetical protein